VMGSGSHPWPERAVPLGRWLAERGVHLLTGGGSGVMAAVSEAFAAVRGREGLVIGVLPGFPDGAAPPGYPNPAVELAIRTHLPGRGEEGSGPRSRNAINVLSSDLLVALPGGAGTASEVAFAARFAKPLVAWLESPDELPGLTEGTTVAPDLEGVIAFLEARLAQFP